MPLAGPLADLGAGTEALARKLASVEGGGLLQAGADTVEIAHEALITQWPWLQSEIQAAAADVRSLGRLGEAARFWRSRGGGAEDVALGGELEEFEGLRAVRADWLNAEEADFLDRSAAAREAEQEERAEQFRTAKGVSEALCIGPPARSQSDRAQP